MKRMVLFAPVAVIVLLLLSAGPVDKAAMERGQKVYKQHCATCHQPDGGGVPGLNPPLDKTSYVLGSKTRLIQIVLKGLKTDEEIDGEEYSNTMAPLNYLKDQQISDVLTYVRNSFGNKATPVTPGDVKYVRAKTR